MEEPRPDPDQLLEQLRADEHKASRCKLRIYFGSSAGVGKTYAMLQAARKLQSEGLELLVGVVETHGRSETLALVDGLPLLPAREIEHRGKTLPEFDLDAALAAKPALRRASSSSAGVSTITTSSARSKKVSGSVSCTRTPVMPPTTSFRLSRCWTFSVV